MMMLELQTLIAPDLKRQQLQHREGELQAQDQAATEWRGRDSKSAPEHKSLIIGVR